MRVRWRKQVALAERHVLCEVLSFGRSFRAPSAKQLTTFLALRSVSKQITDELVGEDTIRIHLLADLGEAVVHWIELPCFFAAEERERKARVVEHLPIFTVSSEMFRKRTPEEMEELRQAQRSADAPSATGACTLGLASESSRTKTAPWN